MKANIIIANLMRGIALFITTIMLVVLTASDAIPTPGMRTFFVVINYVLLLGSVFFLSLALGAYAGRKKKNLIGLDEAHHKFCPPT
ncbi:MAG: hypothetical protein H6502_04290 [Candidatus Woesearchaeota archaeon]|nr:MAG: hypothetical protein H6502_04290 [Candidatus Woesearchaeota archaeon]